MAEKYISQIESVCYATLAYVLSASLTWHGFVINCFQFFAYLAQTHSSVRKDLVFRDLLLDDLCEDYLERKAETALLQVLFKHQCLFLALSHVFFRGRVWLQCDTCWLLVHFSRLFWGLDVVVLWNRAVCGLGLDFVHCVLFF